MNYLESIMEEYQTELDRVNSKLAIKSSGSDLYKDLERRKDHILAQMSDLAIRIGGKEPVDPVKSLSEEIYEWGKLLIPVVVPIIAYDIFQKRLLKYEETGTICSSAGRQLHLPRFFK